MVEVDTRSFLLWKYSAISSTWTPMYIFIYFAINIFAVYNFISFIKPTRTYYVLFCHFFLWSSFIILLLYFLFLYLPIFILSINIPITIYHYHHRYITALLQRILLSNTISSSIITLHVSFDVVMGSSIRFYFLHYTVAWHFMYCLK